MQRVQRAHSSSHCTERVGGCGLSPVPGRKMMMLPRRCTSPASTATLPLCERCWMGGADHRAVTVRAWVPRTHANGWGDHNGRIVPSPSISVSPHSPCLQSAGWTALDAAVDQGHDATVAALLAHPCGSDVLAHTTVCPWPLVDVPPSSKHKVSSTAPPFPCCCRQPATVHC